MSAMDCITKSLSTVPCCNGSLRSSRLYSEVCNLENVTISTSNKFAGVLHSFVFEYAPRLPFIALRWTWSVSSYFLFPRKTCCMFFYKQQINEFDVYLLGTEKNVSNPSSYHVSLSQAYCLFQKLLPQHVPHLIFMRTFGRL